MAGSHGADVVIIGGGIIGLSLAWRLAGEGASVVLLERGQVGGQATGAAAGMLAPLAEAGARCARVPGARCSVLGSRTAQPLGTRDACLAP